MPSHRVAFIGTNGTSGLKKSPVEGEEDWDGPASPGHLLSSRSRGKRLEDVHQSGITLYSAANPRCIASTFDPSFGALFLSLSCQWQSCTGGSGWVASVLETILGITKYKNLYELMQWKIKYYLKLGEVCRKPGLQNSKPGSDVRRAITGTVVITPLS